MGNDYKTISFLLGCYMVVIDKEINEMEVRVLDQYLNVNIDDPLFVKRQEIFSDDENKVSKKDLVDSLRLQNLTQEQKNEIMTMLTSVALADGYMAPDKMNLLKEVGSILKIDIDPIIKEIERKMYVKQKSEQLSLIKKLIGKAENQLYDILGGDKNAKIIDMLLGSLGYSVEIEKITKNAIVDLNRVSKITYYINNKLNQVEKTLRSTEIRKLNSTKEVEQVAQSVQIAEEHFVALINNSLSKNIETLEKKKRNIRYFTIAFMGRTKAGKSTLHKVITQQENDDIGVGKIRTTRYNRSWYWGRLRVIDTPGIGAPGGETDTKIAKSIIEEADVICYVVTSDSIQETEFDFFEKIKERNKPLYIVLNVKSNLNQEIRLKKFLSEPQKWMTENGEQSIAGHIERIHDRLDGKYNMDAIKIIPIHLLAAQIGLSGTLDKKSSEKLIIGSNILSFTRSVKKTVHESGSLKKSLSIIDGTAYQVNEIYKTVFHDYSELKDGLEILSAKRNKFQKFIKEEKKRLCDDLSDLCESTKKKLYNRAASFASENYDRKDAGNIWKNDKVVQNTQIDMQERVNSRISDFTDKLKSEMEELAMDINLCSSFCSNSVDISGSHIRNTRLGVGIVGSIFSAAAPFIIANIWHPGGWILAISSVVIGGLVALITSLFMSKEKKIQKAIEKMRNHLYESIDNSINNTKTEILTQVRKSVNSAQKSIEDILSTYIDNISFLVSQVYELCENCKAEEASINSLIGLRMMEYVGRKIEKGKKIDAMNNDLLRNKFPVERDWIKQSFSYNFRTGIEFKKISVLEEATQMKIHLNKEN